jgi:protein-tyrosine phosphatase
LKKSSILFVCLGNICRSPAAEALAGDFAKKLGLEHRVEIASAGTANYQVGRPADKRMREAAARRGYSIDTKARQLTDKMVREASWLIAMDRENYRESVRIARDFMPVQLHLLSDFLGDPWPRDVPDPYLGGDDQFDFVLDMLEAAMPMLFSSIFPQAINGSASEA